MKCRYVASLIGTGVLTSAVTADFAPGEILFNPALQGTGEIGAAGPHFDTTTPAWVEPGNLLARLTTEITPPAAGSLFSGEVVSEVYQADAGALGFRYQISLDAGSARNLVRPSLDPPGWENAVILAVGSDGSGDSTPATGNTAWTDGDPFFIERAGGPEANLSWQLRLGSDGTQLNPLDRSAWLWMEVVAEAWGESSMQLPGPATASTARVLSVVVPEPAAASQSVVAILAVVAMRRR